MANEVATDEEIAAWKADALAGSTNMRAALIARVEADARRIAELTRDRNEKRGMAKSLLQQRNDAQRNWIEMGEALGCTEVDDDPVGCVRAIQTRIAALERVTGPMMKCGCYAVEFEQWSFGMIACDRHRGDDGRGVAIEPTPEYLTWRQSR